MAQPPFPASTNVDGSNPGPNYAQQPDTVQMPTGNIWKIGTFSLVITPTILTTGPAITVETFAATGIGLLTTDRVLVEYAGTQTAAVGILDSRVSANDTLEIKFLATAGTPTPAAGTAAVPYYVTVFRIQPNWTAPVSGNQLDW
jgi:hypothetical protein